MGFVAAVYSLLLVRVAGTDTKKVPGCYLRDARYLLTHLDHVTNPIENVFDFFECQMLCSKTQGCGRFVYLPSKLFCYLGAGDEGVEVAQGAVSGPAVCPEVPQACHQLPTGPFPAETPEASQRAWPMNYTPTLLQCWPWNADVQPAFCRSHPPVTIQKSTDAGKCQGLQLVDLPEAESCGQNCAGNVLCSSWQERSEEGKQDDISCYQGLGEDCYGTKGPAGVTDAGRFQHGQYRVLAELKYVQLMGLSFGFAAQSPSDKAVARCRDLCLSLLPCQAWQYSSDAGCYIENFFTQPMPYPPVVQKGSSFAQTAVAGEYLQRLCPGYLSRVRGDARDDEVKSQASIMVSYNTEELPPQQAADAPVPLPASTESSEPEQPSAEQPSSKPAPPLSPSTDAIVPTTSPLQPGAPATGAATASIAAAAAVTATATAAAAPAPATATVASVGGLPTAAAAAATAAPTAAVTGATALPAGPATAVAAAPAPVAPAATLAPVATLAPMVTLAPPVVLPPVASSNSVEFRHKDQGQAQEADLKLRAQGKRSISDWLAVSLGVFGLLMVCLAAHCVRTWPLSRRKPTVESEEEEFLPN